MTEPSDHIQHGSFGSDKDPGFQVGDLVVFENAGEYYTTIRGVVYWIADSERVYGNVNRYKVTPVFGCFGGADRRPNVAGVEEKDLKKLTLLELGVEANKLLQFVRTAARQLAGEVAQAEEDG